MTDEQLGSVERSEVMAVIGRALWSPLRSEALRIKGERMSWVLAIPALSPRAGGSAGGDPLAPPCHQAAGFGGGPIPATLNMEAGSTSVLGSSVSQAGRLWSPHTQLRP